jgi:hypothetical protein
MTTANKTANQRIHDLMHVIAGALNAIQDDNGTLVQVGAQALTQQQQAQVLANIGAASRADLLALHGAINALAASHNTVLAAIANPPAPAAPAAGTTIAEEDFASTFVGQLTNPTIQAAAQQALSSTAAPASPAASAATSAVAGATAGS